MLANRKSWMAALLAAAAVILIVVLLVNRGADSFVEPPAEQGNVNEVLNESEQLADEEQTEMAEEPVGSNEPDQDGDPSSSAAAVPGFTIKGSELLDANGEPFIMRGVNYPHSWFKGSLAAAIPAISNAGSNTVRVVLSDGSRWTIDNADTVRRIIELCESNGLVAMLEVHDATGKDDYESLEHAVQYWIGLKDVLIGKEDRVMINIANEWYGSWKSRGWADGYIKAIPKLREAGLTHTIVVDAAGWGQYPKSIHDYGMEVFEADPLRNVLFSIHMYEYAGANESMIKRNIDGVLDQGLPVIVGEFGHRHTDGDVDENYILAYAEEKQYGWLAWSWKGNSQEWAYLDLSEDWEGTRLTEWGSTIVEGPNGLQETGKRASIFE